MLIGYARVSTEEQNESRQVEALRQKGVEKIFVDKQTGANTNRPEFKQMMEFVREGDTVITESFSRISRSTRDLLKIVDTFKIKRVEFISMKENVDTSTPQGKFMLTIFAALGELEREQILQRQREGIEIAKAAGKYKGRKPIEVDLKKFERVYKQWRGENLITARRAMEILGLQPTKFYRFVKQYEIEKGIRKE